MSNLIDAIAEKSAEKAGWYYINEFRKRLRDQGYEIVDKQARLAALAKARAEPSPNINTEE